MICCADACRGFRSMRSSISRPPWGGAFTLRLRRPEFQERGGPPAAAVPSCAAAPHVVDRGARRERRVRVVLTVHGLRGAIGLAVVAAFRMRLQVEAADQFVTGMWIRRHGSKG